MFSHKSVPGVVTTVPICAISFLNSAGSQTLLYFWWLSFRSEPRTLVKTFTVKITFHKMTSHVEAVDHRKIYMGWATEIFQTCEWIQITIKQSIQSLAWKACGPLLNRTPHKNWNRRINGRCQKYHMNLGTLLRLTAVQTLFETTNQKCWIQKC